MLHTNTRCSNSIREGVFIFKLIPINFGRLFVALSFAGLPGQAQVPPAQTALPPPVADANRSGEVNEIDIMVFATDAAANEPAADLDQDGLVIEADVSAFFEAYSMEVQ